MTAVAGSIELINLNGNEFTVAADSDSSRNLGGFTNEWEANGNGSARLVKTRKTWKIGGLAVSIDDDQDDDTTIQDLMDLKAPFPIFVTFASGKTYQGSGQITGDADTSSQSQTKAIDLSGPGKLTLQ